jgi:hypothetical protein
MMNLSVYDANGNSICVVQSEIMLKVYIFRKGMQKLKK